MRGIVKHEFVKLLYNKYLYFSILLTAIVMLLCTGPSLEKERFDMQVYYMSFIFLITSCLMVGSIVANEYTGTIKEIVMACQNRTYIYCAKWLAVVFAMTLLFLVYVSLLWLTSKINVTFALNQYMTVMQHTFLMIGLSILLKSFSALAVATAVLLCLYQQVFTVSIPFSGWPALSYTYCYQFTSTGLTTISLTGLLLTAVLCGGAGLFLFLRQELSTP